MNERTQLKGILAETKQRVKEHDLEAKGLILLIRNLLNPYESDLASIKIDEALQSMKRLHQIVSELKTLKAKIIEIEEALNG